MENVAYGATTKFALVRGVYTGDPSGFTPRFDPVILHQKIRRNEERSGNELPAIRG